MLPSDIPTSTGVIRRLQVLGFVYLAILQLPGFVWFMVWGSIAIVLLILLGMGYGLLKLGEITAVSHRSRSESLGLHKRMVCSIDMYSHPRYNPSLQARLPVCSDGHTLVSSL